MPGTLPLVLPLHAAEDESRFGAKAVSLGRALRSGLPVPDGLALSAELVDRVAAGEPEAHALLDTALEDFGPFRLAVRSSAVGEDSADASFAGQHETRLNITRRHLAVAVRGVHASAHTEAALGYRAKHGLPLEPQIGVVVQQMVEPVAAGVLFTRNPMTGADEVVIEAAWGLGEAVVSGIVTPDHFTLTRSGALVGFTPGLKDLKVWYAGEDTDGTIELPVPDDLQQAPCLTAAQLQALHGLAARCQAAWGDALDLEWAVGHGEQVYLLQCQPITTVRA